ncbi:hypothetical protein [Corynebacterium pilosum]|uniref:Hypothetical membrane protein n=1 Tax=Corynebacterium pilosum TaxID=35756 RepID=A0A376CMK6_9CORY|nr:hypothetical protein [Corynebacterium pilosum]STC69553.1 hypothetical membrane protein [Corynebacterium pilosum]
MPSMFPSFSAHPDDLNRRYDMTVGDDWPRSLKISFWLIIVGAVLMLVTAMRAVAVGVPDQAPNQEFAEAYLRNMWFMVVVNAVTALVMAGAASYLRKGSRTARIVVAVCIAVACFFNVVAFAIRIAGLSAIVIVAVLAFAALFLFRPKANAYIAKKTEESR